MTSSCLRTRVDPKSKTKVSLPVGIGFFLVACFPYSPFRSVKVGPGGRPPEGDVATHYAPLKMADPAATVGDPSEAPAEHIPVKKLSIGSWNLSARYDEHVLISFYWAERKLVWEVLHLGVVRKMEVDFEDVDRATLSPGVQGQDRLVIELHRPPRFFKENVPAAGTASGQEVSYVYTTDFTNGQASAESRHTLFFEPGALQRETAKMMVQHGIRLTMENESGSRAAAGARREAAAPSHSATRARAYLCCISRLFSR